MDGPGPIVLITTVLAYAALGLLALRHRLLARVAVREAIRRPVQAVLVVAGLTVGTGAILGPQLWYDSITDSMIAAAYREWGRVDLVVSAGGATFAEGVADRLAADVAGTTSVAGVQGGLDLTGSVANVDEQLSVPTVRVIGFDPTAQRAFGAYVLESGATTDGQGLAPGEVILSRSLAAAINAEDGDRIWVQVNGVQTDLTVAGIARPEGPGLQSLRPAVFAPLATASAFTGPNLINVVRVTATGEGQAETDAAREVAPILRGAVGQLTVGPALQVREVKADEATAYNEYEADNRWVFMAPGIAVVLIGSALVINLILSVADERRPRLAILRALGLSRRGLVTLSLIEGGLYGLGAATVSLVTGGLVALIMFTFMSTANLGDVNGRDVVFQPSIRPGTVASAVALGALITLVTVFLAAVRTSRMTIASAIRNLPEPEAVPGRSWRRLALLVVLAVAGVLGLLAEDPRYRVLGGCALIAVATALARGRLSDRARATVAGAFVTAWTVAVFAAYGVNADNIAVAVQLYLGGALTVVAGLALMLAANLRVLEGLTVLFGRASAGLRATLRPPLAYMTRRPLRAGLSISVLGAVIATLTLWIVLEVGSIDYERDSGGIDVEVTSAGSRLETLPPTIRPMVARSIVLPTRRYIGQVRFTFAGGGLAMDWHEQVVPLYELSESLVGTQLPRLSQRDTRFASDLDAFRAVATDPTWVIASWWGGPGGTVVLRGADGPVELKVAGTLALGYLDGVIGSRDALAPFTESSAGTTVLVEAQPGVDPDALALDIRRSLFSEGVEAYTTKSILDEGLVQSHTWSAIFRLLGEIGLVAGVLSVGVLALRSVFDRRRTIGILRALGSQRRSIVAGVLMEGMLTIALSIAIGLAAGLLSSYFFWNVASLAAPVSTIDSGHAASSLAAVYGVLLAVTFVVTIGPAVMASRLTPVDALRLID